MSALTGVIRFRTGHVCCTECSSRLKAYKTVWRPVQMEAGRFTAVEHVMYCRNGHELKLFRSEHLASIVNRGCTYANDVMPSAARMRFTEGRSCSEIARAMDTGISERHVCRLSGTALSIFAEIHGRSGEALRPLLGRWVLQIDGTVDGEYDMIVTVRAVESGFILSATKCRSESLSELKIVLEDIEKRFGTPVASISDMRQSIFAAMEAVFPGVPTGVCKYHYMRDLGKDLMEDRHAKLGRLLRTHGTRAALERALDMLPPYDMAVLKQVGDGYCGDRKAMALMSARRIIGEMLHDGERSGYGFPFSLRHLYFMDGCISSLPRLTELNGTAESDAIRSAIAAMEAVASDSLAMRLRDELTGVYAMFDCFRKAMYPEHHGTPLSDEPVRSNSDMRKECERVVKELEERMNTSMQSHLFTAARHIVAAYRKWEGRLFLSELDGIVPHTNNALERVFRKVRRNVRKRCGDRATGRQLTLNGDHLLLFQNMSNAAYVRAVFGGSDIATVFAKERAALAKKTAVMTRKRMEELIDSGTQMLLSGNLPETPYTGKLWLDVDAVKRGE